MSSIRDELAAMEMAFDLINQDNLSCEVSVGGDGDDNGWILLKTSHGYSFQLLCITPVAGFRDGFGCVYAYKNGDDETPLDWPTVEFSTIPRMCFLSRDEVVPLLHQLKDSNDPERSGGFTFDPNRWKLLIGLENYEGSQPST